MYVCMYVYTYIQELRGGGSNDRGYWSVDVVDVNARGGSMQRTALHAAAARGHLDAVRLLCDEHGAAIDVLDHVGRYVCMYVCICDTHTHTHTLSQVSILEASHSGQLYTRAHTHTYTHTYTHTHTHTQMSAVTGLQVQTLDI